MWSWNVLGVALWVALIVYLTFIVQNIRKRRLRMIIERHHSFEWGNFAISIAEIAIFCLALGWLAGQLVFDNPNLNDQARISAKVKYQSLILQPSASKNYYVKVDSSKTKNASQNYIFYTAGHKYTVPSRMATVSYEDNPINVTASTIPFKLAKLKQMDDRYQKAYVAVYTARYKNTAQNGLGMHAGKVATRFFLIRVPDTSFIKK
ncbi:LVIS_2131 family protein [Lactobacillus porci]|uniref:LVIS_2131 family protein n=1 Tax=Lactobacillus porci TaxID=2012477 RepID=UPI00399120D1